MKLFARGEPSYKCLDIEGYYDLRAVLPECEGLFKAWQAME